MRRLACDWGYTDAKFKQEKHYRMEPAPQVEASQQMMGARLRPERANTKGDGGQKWPGRANTGYSDGGRQRPGRAVTDGDGASKPHAKTTAGPSPQTMGAKRPGRANTVYSGGGQSGLVGPSLMVRGARKPVRT